MPGRCSPWSDPSEISQMAQDIVVHGRSVREVEAMVRGETIEKPRGKMMKKPAAVRSASADARRIEEALRQRLGTDVRLTAKRRGTGTVDHLVLFQRRPVAAARGDSRGAVRRMTSAMGAVDLQAIVEYLDGFLETATIPDYDGALNGLQVDNSGEITGLVTAVDASQQTIDRVVRECDRGTLLLVHHGLFWDGNLPMTGRRYRRIKALLDHDIAVYSSHLPLDVHSEVGNNAVLARMIGIVDAVPFDVFKGIPFGAAGPLIMARDVLVDRLATMLGTRVQLIPGGPETTTRVGVITGGAGGRVAEASAAGLDTFITGEGAHHNAFDALEAGVNLIYAGHYATETVGVKALGEHLEERFGLACVFHDHPTGT